MESSLQKCPATGSRGGFFRVSSYLLLATSRKKGPRGLEALVGPGFIARAPCPWLPGLDRAQGSFGNYPTNPKGCRTGRTGRAACGQGRVGHRSVGASHGPGVGAAALRMDFASPKAGRFFAFVPWTAKSVLLLPSQLMMGCMEERRENCFDPSRY